MRPFCVIFTGLAVLFAGCEGMGLTTEPQDKPEGSILEVAARRGAAVGVDYQVDYCLFQGGGTARCFYTLDHDGNPIYWLSYVNPSTCNSGNPGYIPCQNGWMGWPSFAMEPGTTGIVRAGNGSVAEIWEWTGTGWLKSEPLENGKYVHTVNPVAGQTAWWRTDSGSFWGWLWLDKKP
jgi:hypothetical protein